jgi:ADP-ribosyl-[dinitrogen reductase] hydrolase
MTAGPIWLRRELLASRLGAEEPLPRVIRWIDLDEGLLLAGATLEPGKVGLPPDWIARVCRWRIAGLRPLVATCTLGPETSPAVGMEAALELDGLTGGCLDAIRILLPHPIPAMQTEGVAATQGLAFRGSQDAAERMRGALLGLAVGDSLGAPVENMAADKIADRYGPFRDFVSGHGWGPGYPTRETIFALSWFRELANGNTVHTPEDRDRLARVLARWVVGRPRDFGHLTRAILQAYLEHPPLPAARIIWERAGRRPEFNAALSRAAAVGIALADEQELRWTSAIVASAMTHPAPVCIASAMAVAEGAAAAVRGEDPLDAARGVVWDERTAESLEEVARGWAPGGPTWNSHGRSHPLKTLRAAFWAVRQPGGFEEVLLDLIHRGGDADTHGAVAGALLGARDGPDAIPGRWLEGLVVRDLIGLLVRRYQSRGEANPGG